MTVKRYLTDMALLEAPARIQEVGGSNGSYWVELDSTIFHPQGGGQRADQGTISGREVLTVRHAELGRVRHFVASLEGLEVGAQVSLSVDAAQRAINSKYHSGGHLIAAVMEEIFLQAQACGGHHWPGEARVVFMGEGLPGVDEVLAKLPARLGEVIGSESPVKIVGDPELDRRLQLAEYEAVPCGGTHVSTTRELDGLKVNKVKFKSKRLRISYSIG